LYKEVFAGERGTLYDEVDAFQEGFDTLFGSGYVAERFEGSIEGVEFTAGVKLLCELLNAGGFAGLSCGVDEEVLLAVDEPLQLGAAGGGGEDVVAAWVAGTGDVEEFFHGTCFFVFTRPKVGK
jgi:hypothetical protein